MGYFPLTKLDIMQTDVQTQVSDWVHRCTYAYPSQALHVAYTQIMERTATLLHQVRPNQFNFMLLGPEDLSNRVGRQAR